MAINLSTVSISLDRFDAVSDGTFNIGHIKLSEDGTDIVRTNRHKTFEFLNNDTIPPEETLAIKDAFCRALSQERLSDKAMDDIRARLGLKRGTVGSLSPRDMRPLTAAQVREILDKYAGEINANRASRNNAERVRTSSEIHRGVSEQALKDRRAVCDDTNVRSEAKMTIRAGNDLEKAMNMFHLIGTDPRVLESSEETTALAGDILANLSDSKTLRTPGKTLMLHSVPLTLMRGNQGTLLACVRLDAETAFTLDTGRTKDELLLWARGVLGLPASSAAPAPGHVPGKRSLSQRERDRLLVDIRDAFNIVNNTNLMNQMVQVKLPSVPEQNNGRTFSEETRRMHAEYEVREDLVDNCVKPLVIALNDVRPKDPRNGELVNKVRAIIGGAKVISTDSTGKQVPNTRRHREQVIEEITGILSKNRYDPETVVKNVKLEGIDDDEIEGNLNIDAIEGGA